MSEQSRVGVYVYQPFGMQHRDHWAAGRIYGVGGLSLLSRCDGFTKEEATAIVAALSAPAPSAVQQELELRVAYLEGTALPHARKQAHADGFQTGWHAALERIRHGDGSDDLLELVPKPSQPSAEAAPEKCRVYFVDHPGVCDLPAGHAGEHRFNTTIVPSTGSYYPPQITTEAQSEAATCCRYRGKGDPPQDCDFPLCGCNEPAAAPSVQRTVKFGVIEFHSDAPLRTRFYAVVDDLQASGSIVDVWLMDIATVLKEHGYEMTITTQRPLPARLQADQAEK